MQEIEKMLENLQGQSKFLSLEITPNLGAKLEFQNLNDNELLDSVNAFVCTDSPLARFKPSAIFSSLKFQNALKKPVICTLGMRERNKMALCGDILAVNELGVRAFLTLTGDPVKLGDCKDSKGVFEGNSLELAKIINDLNAGVALNGKNLGSSVQRIYHFCVMNSYAQNPETLKNKMRKKISVRPSAIFTQPIFCADTARFLLDSLAEVKKEVLDSEISQSCSAQAKDCQNIALVFGFFPVLSLKVALFLRDKLPGVFIPESWIEALQKGKSVDDERKIGMDLSLELFAKLNELHNKFHFMSAGNPNLVKEFVR